MKCNTVGCGGDVIDAPRSGGVNSKAKPPAKRSLAGVIPEVLQKIRWSQEDNKIPREIFTDPDLFRLEMDAVLTGQVWVLVGHESEIPQPGDYKTISAGSIPVIVIRGANERVGVVLNACAHRGTRLVEGHSGNVLRDWVHWIDHNGTYDTAGLLVA